MSKFLPLNLFIRQALLYPLTFPFLPPVDKVEKGHKYAAGRLIGTFEAPVSLPRTGQLVSYGTGDDGDLQKGLTLERPQDEAARFTDHGDGTITDKATGLMWVKDPIASPGAPFNARMNWFNALSNCLALNFAGHTDWRLPNWNELFSIINRALHTPALNETYFPNYETYAYWSSTTLASATARKWVIFYGLGTQGDVDKYGTCWVRPVRLGIP